MTLSTICYVFWSFLEYIIIDLTSYKLYIIAWKVDRLVFMSCVYVLSGESGGDLWCDTWRGSHARTTIVKEVSINTSHSFPYAILCNCVDLGSSPYIYPPVCLGSKGSNQREVSPFQRVNLSPTPFLKHSILVKVDMREVPIKPTSRLVFSSRGSQRRVIWSFL